jgi:hypothetical protein
MLDFLGSAGGRAAVRGDIEEAAGGGAAAP